MPRTMLARERLAPIDTTPPKLVRRFGTGTRELVRDLLAKHRAAAAQAAQPALEAIAPAPIAKETPPAAPAPLVPAASATRPRKKP